MFDDATHPVSPAMREVLAWSVAGIGEPGTWLDGAQRVSVAAEARASLSGLPGTAHDLSDELAEVAHAVAEAPADITPEWIDQLETRGLDRFSYVEAVGVVCRIAVADTIALGVGAAPVALPEPGSGAPARVPATDAIQTQAWVPVVSPVGALSSLSAVDGENESMRRMSDVLYLKQVVPVNMVEKGGLRRSQIEVLAARTSYLNDCFY